MKAWKVDFDAKREPMFMDEYGGGWVPLAKYDEALADAASRLATETARADAAEEEAKYAGERAGILSSAIGLARLRLRQGKHEAAANVLDDASDKTQRLLVAALARYDAARTPE